MSGPEFMLKYLLKEGLLRKQPGWLPVSDDTATGLSSQEAMPRKEAEANVQTSLPRKLHSGQVHTPGLDVSWIVG